MSVWQTPHASRRTSTSPAFGSSSSTSCTTSGSPNASSTAALILTTTSSGISGGESTTPRAASSPAARGVDVGVVVVHVVRRARVDVGHLAAVRVLPRDLDVHAARAVVAHYQVHQAVGGAGGDALGQ